MTDYHQVGVVTLAAFIATFLRGFQSMNVARGQRKAAAVTGYLMALAEAAVIGVLAASTQNGYTETIKIAMVSGLGVAAGYYLSMRFHRWITRSQRRTEKQRKKLKFRKRVLKEFNSLKRSES